MSGRRRTTPAQIDAGDGTTALENVQIASNAFRPRVRHVDRDQQREPLFAPRPRGGHRLVGTCGDRRSAGRRVGARPGDRRHRPGRRTCGERSGGFNGSIRWRSPRTATRCSSPQPPAPARSRAPDEPARPRARPPREAAATRSGGGQAPGHGHDRARRDVRRHDAGRRNGEDRHRPLGPRPRACRLPPPGSAAWAVVRVTLKQGRNVVRVKRVKRHKLARGRSRATIKPKTGGRTLRKIRLTFKLRR